jgi:hypothetical protein
MATVRDRERLTSGSPPAPAAVQAKPGTGAKVLGLQQAGGNQAVGRWLTGPGGPLYAGPGAAAPTATPAPTAPAAAPGGTLLAGLDAATRTGIQVATVNVPADFVNEDTFARNAPRELRGVDVVYGAKVPTDAGLRTGLQVIAWDLLDPADRKPDVDSPFRDNSTTTLELDLKRFKGEDGLWQFTSTSAGTPPKRRLLIDYLGPAPRYDMPEKAATRFSELGLTTRAGTAGSFGGGDKEALYTAVSLLPPAAAAKLPRGLVFVRDSTPPADVPADAGGVHRGNTIRLLDRWTTGSQVRYERATPKVAVVLHELGHAIDEADREAHAAFAGALRSDGGTAVTGYGEKDSLESYAECFFLYVADPKLLALLRPNVYAYFAGAFGGTPSTGAGTPRAGAGSGAAPGRH